MSMLNSLVLENMSGDALKVHPLSDTTTTCAHKAKAAQQLHERTEHRSLERLGRDCKETYAVRKPTAVHQRITRVGCNPFPGPTAYAGTIVQSTWLCSTACMQYSVQSEAAHCICTVHT